MQGINVLDYATLTAAAAAVSLTADASPTLPAACKRVYITSEDAACRWRSDGTAPTADEGHLLLVNDSISFTGENYRSLLENIQFIADTATACKLKITYFD